MTRSRADWLAHLRTRKNHFGTNHDLDSILKKPSKSKKAEGVKVIPKLRLNYTTEQLGPDTHYISEYGHIIVGKKHIAVKMPYGLSANEIWRATIDKKTEMQRNSLSLPARNYKKSVSNIYTDFIEKIGLEKITTACEVRIIAQPPLKPRNYTAQSYPRFDIDNYPKLIIDALKGILFTDDKLFISEQIILAEPIPDGCVWVSCIFKNTEQSDWLKRRVNFQWLAGDIT
ncbi:RusA family crossover junction endodeoxyribonuclease [Acinetobacter boissieri]|uniref:Endodeoxyribonuclease RusA n=1 Tax=Acinetobacter boissieri TaxID=1219383 RepID=A0A1G6KEG0_9GAMM|nr:RusA family crossover junction endodeoxyribonuclease [Acinetobacter boissieri]SDC28696.1 Endodeoxyribonuclease RusA [Acinetobacter boissieri]